MTMQQKRPIDRSLTIGLIISVLLMSCGQPKADKKDGPPPAVSVELIKPSSFTRSIPLTGSVEPTRVATLSSPAEGPAMDCSIREGDKVVTGQVLLRIGRDASADASLTAAREELERRKLDFKRIEALVAQKALAAEQLDIARSNLENARAALVRAQEFSSDYLVRAPWTGIVSRLHIADGRYVAPRAPLVDLFDPSSLVLRFQVPEQHALAVQEGETIRVHFDAIPNQSFELPIVRAYPELDRRLRQRTFEAALPLEAYNFQPGFFARIQMDLERIEQALTVPIEALARNADGQPIVYTVVDGVAVVKVIQCGFEQSGRILVLDGLAPGDAVIVRGIEKIRPGTKVRVANAPPANRKEP